MNFFKKDQNVPRSIYQQICSEFDQHGKIREGFQLITWEDLIGTQKKIQFAPGVLDGITIYHGSGNQSVDEDLFSLIQHYSYKERGQIQTIEAIVESMGFRTLLIADDLAQQIIDYAAQFSIKDLYDLSIHLMKDSCSIEAVKLGIVISEIIRLEKNDELIRVLRMLGYYDEFTYFVLVSLDDKLATPDAYNQLCINYAEHSKGWGKVHSIKSLKEPTAKIQNWILKNGCKNNLLASYNSMDCLKKGHLLTVLEQEKELDESLFQGITEVMIYLLTDSPLSGLADCENDLFYIEKYLGCAEHQDLFVKKKEVLSKVMKYLEKHARQREVELLKEKALFVLGQ